MSDTFSHLFPFFFCYLLLALYSVKSTILLHYSVNIQTLELKCGTNGCNVQFVKYDQNSKVAPKRGSISPKLPTSAALC